MTTHSRQTTERPKLLKICQEDCFLQEMKAVTAAREALFTALHKHEWLTLHKTEALWVFFFVLHIICINLYTKVNPTQIKVAFAVQSKMSSIYSLKYYVITDVSTKVTLLTSTDKKSKHTRLPLSDTTE